jgi:GT2 family glycosyltransferase
MKDNPKVYIVILNYNSYEDTIECVKHCKNITYKNYDIIVVDNNSTDDSFNILSDKLNDIIILKSEINKGYAYGNNLAIKAALEKKAEYICILNSDVIVEEDFLEPLVNALQNDEKLGIVGPCVCQYDFKDRIQAIGSSLNICLGLARSNYKGELYSNIKKGSISVDYVGGACLLFKSEILDKTGLIPENYFLFFEETEFCYKAKKKGYDCKCIVSSRVYHKGSATISRYKGLGYYLLHKNRIVFIRRNGNVLQRIIFSLYIPLETIGRIIIRREPLNLIKFYFNGAFSDTNTIDEEGIKTYMTK